MFLLFGIIQLFQQNVLIFQSNMLSRYLIREGTVKEIEQKKKQSSKLRVTNGQNFNYVQWI